MAPRHPQAALHLDAWLKDVAPSPELRRWWGHDPATFDDFSARYVTELESNESSDLARLKRWAREGDVTLLFAARDPQINHAVVLARWLSTEG